MEFRLLGPLEVLDGGRPVELPGLKQRVLLAFLLLEANRLVSRDRLIDALWEDEPTATAAKALQVYISQLRKALGHDRVLTRSTGYLLRADWDEIDLTRFEHLYGIGKPHEALALWRGAPLAEFVQRRFAQPEIFRLDELYLACLESRIEIDLTEGRHADVVGELEALVKSHPLRERLQELLLLALYRSGRQADALAAYQAARRTLVEELGIEPAKPLRDLHQAILRQDPNLDVAPLQLQKTPGGLFVGRRVELELLRAALADAIAGRGRLVLLVGEPGIGKSRLADELIRAAGVRGVEVLVGRCWEASGAPAYWPWVQALRRRSDGAPPELAALLRGEPNASESEGARFRLFDATATFLRSVTRERALVLFLDDMHAADESSLLLLRFLSRELDGAHLLIVAACRDVDPVPARGLSTALADVAREPGTTRIRLHGLAEDDVAAYVGIAAADFASPDLIAALFEETEGNPLFLAETVRLLAVEGRIAIPESVREVIERRLGHLSEDCHRVLGIASVLGREFELDVLARMSGAGEEELIAVLDEATEARILSNGLRFAHVLIRDVLYEGLTAPRRARLHRRAAEELEELRGEESLAELAYHAVAGRDFDRALEWGRRAGDRALELLAYEEAARLYSVALDARPDEMTRCALLLARGEAEMRGGSTDTAKETFGAAADIARRLSLPHELAQAAVGYGGRIVWVRAGDDERLVPLLEEALAALGDDDPVLRCRLLARLAGALRDEPDRGRREALSTKAVELARAAGDSRALAYALDAHGYAILGPDTADRCLALARELGAAAAATGDVERAVASNMLAVMSLIMLGDIPRLEEELENGIRKANELKQAAQLAQGHGVRALLMLSQGRLAEGEALLDERFELGREALPRVSLSIHRCQRHMLCDLRGDLAPVEREIAELVPMFVARPVLRCVLAQVHARVGRVAEARRALHELAPTLPFDQEWLYGMSLLVETAVLLDDEESMPTLYQALSPWGELNAADIAEGCRGAVSRYLGLLAMALGRPDDAAAHFERALELNERMGFVPWLARTQDDYAVLLRRRGEDSRAALLEAEALTTYAAVGMAAARTMPE